MLFEMQSQPFTAFMNVESTRSYIDNLYSQDPNKCLAAIVCIKNSVIGSNRQKASVIEQGIVPRLISLLKEKNTKIAVRVEAAVTVGSLAKGTEEHIELLINSGTTQVLLQVLDETEARLIDACLCCLRTLSLKDEVTKYSQKDLQKLLSFAGTRESLLRQACVASILSAACKTAQEQNALCIAGAPSILASLLGVENCSVRKPVITCLAAMCRNNQQVAKSIINTTVEDIDILNYLLMLISRDKPIEMQLEVAKCLTNLYRAGAIPPYQPIITLKTLPCLVRICQVEHLEQNRAAAADTLAYLTEVDSNLQQIAAISNQLISALVDLLKCPSVEARKAAFRAFASLGANDEDIRKRIIDTKCLMDRVVVGLGDENKDIRLAAVCCLHSLSRSVQQLRTTFQDHTVWKPLMALLTNSPSNELLAAALSALCNLLLQFSPAKEPMLQQGVMQLLASLTSQQDPSLRLNAVWALMNLAFQSEQRVKSQIITTLGTDQIFRLLVDPDTRVLMKTLGLLRNLIYPKDDIDTMMALHGAQVMQGIVLVLEAAHPPEVKEQALCILVNIADGARAKDHIMSNEDVLKKLIDYMNHPAVILQEAALYCIGNLARRGEPGAVERQMRLKDLGVVNILQQLLSTPDHMLYNRVKSALTQFADV